MNLTDITTKGYIVLRNFLDEGDVDRLIGGYKQSIDNRGSNKNYGVVSSKIDHSLEDKIHPLLSSIREVSDLTVDMCYKGGMYFRSESIDFKWHQDHETYYLTQQATNAINLWIPLIKPDRNNTGLSIVPFDKLGTSLKHFLGFGARNINIIDSSTITVEDCENGDNFELSCDIESLAVSPEIGPRDVLVMRGDTLHRTQDTMNDRLAMSIRCFDSRGVISRDKFYSGCQHKHTMISNNPRLYQSLIDKFTLTDSVLVGDILPHHKFISKL